MTRAAKILGGQHVNEATSKVLTKILADMSAAADGNAAQQVAKDFLRDNIKKATADFVKYVQKELKGASVKTGPDSLGTAIIVSLGKHEVGETSIYFSEQFGISAGGRKSGLFLATSGVGEKINAGFYAKYPEYDKDALMKAFFKY